MSTPLMVRSCNECWMKGATSAQGTSLPHKLNRYHLPFAGNVLQDQELGQLHKSMKGDYFTRLSEMIKSFSSKSMKGKNVNNPVRKDSNSTDRMLLCNNLSLDQKWALMTSGHRG